MSTRAATVGRGQHRSRHRPPVRPLPRRRQPSAPRGSSSVISSPSCSTALGRRRRRGRRLPRRPGHRRLPRRLGHRDRLSRQGRPRACGLGLTGVGVDLGVRPKYSALAVCMAGNAVEFAQGYVSLYDIAADCAEPPAQARGRVGAPNAKLARHANVASSERTDRGRRAYRRNPPLYSFRSGARSCRAPALDARHAHRERPLLTHGERWRTRSITS